VIPADTVDTRQTPRAVTVPWPWLAQAYGLTVALGIGYFVCHIPLQVTDCVDNLLDVQSLGFWDLLVARFTAAAFWRPFLWLQLYVSFHLANGHYFAMYKLIHVAQLLVATVLFVRLLRVTSTTAALALPLGIAVLFGSHTFGGNVLEGYPINTYMTIVVCCLMAANLAFGAPAWWRDAAAVTLFAFAALTVESGLIVWAIVIAAWMAGCRGVSRRGVLATTVALLAYFVARFAILHVGTPSLSERSSGFGFSVLEADEIVARFGQHPLLFYGYNVVCQIVSVLFGEPKSGVWWFTRRLVSGELLPRDVIGVVTSAGATLLLAWHVRSRIAAWRRRVITHGDRLLLVFAAVLVFNALISFSYTKAVIVSPAGVFYAMAVTVAFAHAVDGLASVQRVRLHHVGVALLLSVLSAGWAVRLAGLHYNLHDSAYVVRNDWAELGPTPERWHVERDPAAVALVHQLYDDAIGMRVPGTFFYPGDLWKYIDTR
jgi:hypothetical protein